MISLLSNFSKNNGNLGPCQYEQGHYVDRMWSGLTVGDKIMSRQVVLEYRGRTHDLGRVSVPDDDGRGEFEIQAVQEVIKCFYNLRVDLDNVSKFYLVVRAVSQAFSNTVSRGLEERIIRLFLGYFSEEYERMISSGVVN